MPYSDPEKQRAAAREWARKNSQSTEGRLRISKNRVQTWENRKEWYAGVKANLSCIRCGENHPACLDFHHRDRSGKTFTVSKMVIQRYASRERVLEEMAKCDVLCANCHRKLHYQENNNASVV